jgi:hypothetical protein
LHVTVPVVRTDSLAGGESAASPKNSMTPYSAAFDCCLTQIPAACEGFPRLAVRPMVFHGDPVDAVTTYCDRLSPCRSAIWEIGA